MSAEPICLGLIPARGGSKGVPGKNILTVGGMPLIGWTIRAAAESQTVSRVMVTTDSEEIASIAAQLGAETPFLRPAQYATDEADSMGLVKHALTWLKSNEDYEPDIVVLLQPTSPLREARDIDQAVTLFIDRAGPSDTLVSVSEVHKHPYLSVKIGEDGYLTPFLENSARGRRQDLPLAHATNGAIYIGYADYYQRSGMFLGERTIPFVMPQSRSLDVDTKWDIRVADLLLSENE